MQYILYKRTFSFVGNDDGLAFWRNKKGFTMGTKDLEEVYSYYSLPYNSVSQLPAVNIDEIKAGPSMTTKGDEGHGHIAYFHTAIVHGDFLYYIPRHSCKSLENRCSVIKWLKYKLKNLYDVFCHESSFCVALIAQIFL